MKQNRKEILKVNGTEKMCSLSVGETGEMCSSVNADTCGDGSSSGTKVNGRANIQGEKT